MHPIEILRFAQKHTLQAITFVTLPQLFHQWCLCHCVPPEAVVIPWTMASMKR